jgi:hypothetical protein
VHPGDQFKCVEKLKYWKLPMLYGNDQIPDFELCKMENEDYKDGNAASTKNILYEYATKMLLLFSPFKGKEEFPSFENRWAFFMKVLLVGPCIGMQVD